MLRSPRLRPGTPCSLPTGSASSVLRARKTQLFGLVAVAILALIYLPASARATRVAYRGALMDETPTAYWRLDETSGASTAADDSGHGLSGSYSGTSLAAAGALWEDADTAASFSGSTSSNVSVPDSASLNFGANTFSAAAWVKSTAASGTIVGKATLLSGIVPPCNQLIQSNPGPGWALGISNDAGHIGTAKLVYADGTTNPGTCPTLRTAIAYGPSSVVVNDGYWHYVAFSFDRSVSSATIWVDGEPASSPIGLTHGVSNTAPLVIAGQIDLGVDLPALSGQVDEVAVFNHSIQQTDVDAALDAAHYGYPSSCVSNVAAPQLSGGAVQPGQTITTSNGSWSDTCGGSLTYSYDWLGGVDDPAVNSYTVDVGDAGRGVSVQVTACDGSNCSLAESNTVVPVPGAGGSNAFPCSRKITVDILYYQSHVSPTHGGVTTKPNGCWNWRDLRGVNQPNWRICAVQGYPNLVFYGNGAKSVYDDTNASHQSPAESGVVVNSCLGGVRSTLNIEYLAVGNTCPTKNWKRVRGSSITVKLFLYETYCSDSTRDVSSLVSGSSQYSASATQGGVVNIGADIPSAYGGPCGAGTSACKSRMTSDVTAVCNRTGGGWTMGLYSNYGLTTAQADTVVSWINDAMNSCVPPQL